MNAIERLRQWLRQTTGCSCCMIGVILLASSSEKGCSSSTKEEEPEPFIGTYTVTVSPANLTILHNAGPVQVSINVTCAGQKLPPNCQSNPPDWDVSIDYVVDVLIADRNAPSTTALVLSDQNHLPSYSSLTEAGVSTNVVITPRNVPNGLTVKSGVLHVSVQPNP